MAVNNFRLNDKNKNLDTQAANDYMRDSLALRSPPASRLAVNSNLSGGYIRALVSKQKKRSHVGARHSPGRVTAAAGGGLSREALREILARGDAREMRRVEARLRKWLGGTHELVDELEHMIAKLEEPMM